MQLAVYNLAGQVVSEAQVSDQVFGIEPNEAVMHQALVRQLANARLGTHDTLTRGEVSGGGKKPWRQKGTGHARQGSIRAPQWRHGGVVFGPHPRSYKQAMPRKMRRLAIRSALSQKARSQQIRVVTGLDSVEPRAKAMQQALAPLTKGGSALVAISGATGNAARAGSNLEGVKVMLASNLGVADLLKYDVLVLDEAALAPLQENLLKSVGEQPAHSGEEGSI